MITINSKLIRAAQLCQAKNDVRYYLCGIFIGVNGDVVGTNGHVLFKTKHVWGETYNPMLEHLGTDSHGIIVKIDGKIPKREGTVTFDFDAKTATYEAKSTTKIFPISLVDGRYPDYNRIVPSSEREIKLEGPIGFNPEYLGLASIFGTAKFVFNGPNEAALITPNNNYWPKGTSLMVMPARVDV